MSPLTLKSIIFNHSEFSFGSIHRFIIIVVVDAKSNLQCLKCNVISKHHDTVGQSIFFFLCGCPFINFRVYILRKYQTQFFFFFWRESNQTYFTQSLLHLADFIHTIFRNLQLILQVTKLHPFIQTQFFKCYHLHAQFKNKHTQTCSKLN